MELEGIEPSSISHLYTTSTKRSSSLSFTRSNAGSIIASWLGSPPFDDLPNQSIAYPLVGTVGSRPSGLPQATGLRS